MFGILKGLQNISFIILSVCNTNDKLRFKGQYKLSDLDVRVIVCHILIGFYPAFTELSMEIPSMFQSAHHGE